MENIEKLWEYSCSGDIEALKKHFSLNRSELNKRYSKFGREHSLIMGVFRNNQFETVEYLMSVGETVTAEEKKEINKELKRIELLRRLGG